MPDKLLSEQAGKFLGAFPGQMRVIDPDLGVEQRRVFPAVIEAE